MEVVLRGRGPRLEAASLDSHRRSCSGDVGAGGVQGTREGPESRALLAVPGPCFSFDCPLNRVGWVTGPSLWLRGREHRKVK